MHSKQENIPHCSDQPYSSPQQAFEGVDTVTLTFPTRVLLTLTPEERLQVGGSKALKHGLIMFPAGENKVPPSLVGHWFLKAHGVTTATAPAAIA